MKRSHLAINRGWLSDTVELLVLGGMGAPTVLNTKPLRPPSIFDEIRVELTAARQ